MKICRNCGAANSDSAKFCGECGASLSAQNQPKPKDPNPIPNQANVATVSEPLPNLGPSLPSQTGGPTLPDQGSATTPMPIPIAPNQQKPPAQIGQSPATPAPANPYASLYQTFDERGRKADIMFVLDCTGSMQGEIDAIRDAITDFADTIESEAVRVRVGLVEFRDRLYGEEHRVLLFQGHPFTRDPDLFRQEMARLQAWGGGDEPESSLDAVVLALKQPFDAEANKVVVLVTDAPPHIPDLETETIEQVAALVRHVKINQFYLVIKTQVAANQIYLKLLEGTRGLAFDLGKGEDFRSRAQDFKRTLMSLGKTISSMTR